MLIENRNGVVVDTKLVLCSGKAEREAALEMAGRINGDQRVTGEPTKAMTREASFRRCATGK